MNFDVIVVGAGPAGSTAAKFLSEKGISTLLIDKDKFPRDKLCGGGIPVRTLNKYKYIEEEGLIDSYTYGACVYFPFQKDKVKIEMEKPMHAMVIRKKFDNGLVELAKNHGSNLKDGCQIKDIKISKDKVKIIGTKNKSFESNIVIGADGIWSIIAKKSGLGENYKNFGVCLAQEIPLSKKIINDYFSKNKLAHVHINYSGLPGYGWVFPKNDCINVGFGELRKTKNQNVNQSNIRDIFNKYIKTIKENKIIPKEIKFNNIKGGAVASCRIVKTYSEKVLLCGEAAGFINIGGGGIDYAMASGEIAANVAIDALDKGDTSEHYLSKYEKLWMDEFGKDIKLFSRLQSKFGEKMEKLITLALDDKKVFELMIEVFMGNKKFYENKGKLTRRFLYLYLKDLIS